MSEGDGVDYIYITAFIVILVTNIYFILFWTLLMSYEFQKYEFMRKVTSLLKLILRRSKDVDFGPKQAKPISVEKLQKKPAIKKKHSKRLKHKRHKR